MTAVTCVFLDHAHHDPTPGDSPIADLTCFLFGQVAGVVQPCVTLARSTKDAETAALRRQVRELETERGVLRRAARCSAGGTNR